MEQRRYSRWRRPLIELSPDGAMESRGVTMRVCRGSYSTRPLELRQPCEASSGRSGKSPMSIWETPCETQRIAPSRSANANWQRAHNGPQQLSSTQLVESTKRQPRRRPGLLGLGLLTPGGFRANDTSTRSPPRVRAPPKRGTVLRLQQRSRTHGTEYVGPLRWTHTTHTEN